MSEFSEEVRQIIERKVEERTGDVLGEKVEILNDLLEKQLLYCKDNYNIGIYQGLKLALCVLTGEEPDFLKEGGVNCGLPG